MRRLACAGASAAALVATATIDAVPADAAVLGVQDDRLTSGPVEEVSGRIALLRASRARVTRLDVLWSLVAPDRPARPSDPDDPAFNVYRSPNGRDLVKLNMEPIDRATHFIDTTADHTKLSTYHVRPVLKGKEQAPSAAFKLPANA